MKLTGEWATSDVSQLINWGIVNTANGLKVWSTELQNQIKFGEYGDYPTWGQAVLSTSSAASHMSGSDIEVRSQFATTGSLPNTVDTRFRCASCDWPTFGFAHNLAAVSSTPTEKTQYIVGHLRQDNANYLGTGNLL